MPLGRAVLRRAFASAAIVGVALTLINHGAELESGGLDAALAARIALTFVVPFIVSVVSSATAIRDATARP